MREPRIKYYYTALNMRDYLIFQQTRQLTVDAQLTIDTVSGQPRGRTHLVLVDSAPRAAALYRVMHDQPRGVVRVLRIPRGAIQRQHLHRQAVPDTRWKIWHYTQDLTLAHCGVEQFA